MDVETVNGNNWRHDYILYSNTSIGNPDRGEMIIAIIKLLTPTLKGWHKAFKTQGIMTPLRSSVTTYNC